MVDYVVKRLLQGLLLIVVVSMLVFAMMDMMPGDPIELLTDRKVSDEVKDKMRPVWPGSAVTRKIHKVGKRCSAWGFRHIAAQ